MGILKNMTISLIVTLASTAVMASPSNVATTTSRQVQQQPNFDPQKFREEMVRMDQETSKMSLEHIEKLRQMSLKNTNTLYDKIAADQKMLEKMRHDNIRSGKDGTEVIAKSQQSQKEIAKLGEELGSQIQAEELKFQKVMAKRQAEVQEFTTRQANQTAGSISVNEPSSQPPSTTNRAPSSVRR